jgi:prophage regulatory protein
MAVPTGAAFLHQGTKMNLSKAANDNQIDPLLRLASVTEATCLGRSTIYRMMDAGQFPRPLVLGPGSVRWRTSAIVQWMDGLQSTIAA